MVDTLTFSLVSPERELFSGSVNQVDIPGSEGDFGVFPKHSPVMAAIRTGAITVYANETQTQYFIQGGFADVTPEGLTILAEKASPMGEVSKAALEADIEAAKESLANLEGEAALSAQQNLDGLNTIMASL